MKNYDFTLKFELSDRGLDPEIYVDQLYEAGCDDALIGLGKQGEIALNFIRESTSAKKAILSAITDVKGVIPAVGFVEAMPDLVSLTDIAHLLGCSRQNMRKLIVGNRPFSPAPIYQGQVAIWHLVDVLSWLQREKANKVDEALLEVAEITKLLNIVREWQLIKLDLQDEEMSALVLV